MNRPTFSNAAAARWNEMLPGSHEENFNLIMYRIVELPRTIASGFEREAYGAALLLVYLRAFPLKTRNDFRDQLMEKGLLWGGGSTRPARAKGMGETEIQARQRYYRKLVQLRDATYSIASFDALTNPDNPQPYGPEGLIDHPWALSDSEFKDGMYMLRHRKMPEFLEEESDNGEAASRLGTAAGAISKDEFLDFVSEFLQESAKNLKPFLRGTVRLTARASIIGTLLEALEEIFTSGRIASVREAFKRDEPRRVFLRAVGWGTYTPPEAIIGPTAPGYMRDLGVGPS